MKTPMEAWTRTVRAATLAGCILMLGACASVPEGITPVRGFELERYLGRWYEIARLPHDFERGLTHVTATYSRNPDGSVRVVNRGYSSEKGKWEEAVGRARFAGPADTGFLKVSFFGPFYGAYVVFELDPQYGHAFVTGNSRDTLWLLARDPEVPAALYDHFVERAAREGFDTRQLIRVPQTGEPRPARGGDAQVSNTKPR